MIKTTKIKISTAMIKLDSFIKFAGITGIGSDAKEMIKAENVIVNDVICTMRGKKLYKGDIITIHILGEISKYEIE